MNKKKIGYKQYETLLAQAHQKLEILARKYQELQTYFIGYVEYRGDNIMFNDWMNTKIKEAKNGIQQNEQPNEENMEPSPTNQG